MRTLFFFLAVLFSSLFVTAQTLTAPVDGDRILATQLATNTVTPTLENASQLRNNEVMITQIGDRNTSNLNILSDNSSALVTQRGENNYTGITSFANQTNQTVLQTGDDNTVLNFGIFKTENQLLNFTQTGDGNTIIKYGENSISDKLKISVQGNDKTVIVRNFN